MKIIENTQIVTAIREKFLTFDAEGKIPLDARLVGKQNLIYMIVNLKNGKKYIGKTIYLLNRANNYIFKSRNPDSGDHRLIIKAIREEGIENFRMFPISKCKSRVDLAAAERYYVNRYNTIYPYGYNSIKPDNNLGQLHSIGHKHTVSTKVKKSKLVACINPDSKEMYISVGMKLFGEYVGKHKDIIKNAAVAPNRICGFYIIYLNDVDKEKILEKITERVSEMYSRPKKYNWTKSNHLLYYSLVDMVNEMLESENADVFLENGYKCNFLTYKSEEELVNSPEPIYVFEPIENFFDSVCTTDEI